jgi:sec-independent protein translocase protein TatA
VGGIGGPEILVIFVVVLLVFGPRKIPEVARGVGKGLREIRRLTTEFQREMNLSDAADDPRRIGGDRPAPPAAPPAATRGEPAPPAEPAEPERRSDDGA